LDAGRPSATRRAGAEIPARTHCSASSPSGRRSHLTPLASRTLTPIGSFRAQGRGPLIASTTCWRSPGSGSGALMTFRPDHQRIRHLATRRWIIAQIRSPDPANPQIRALSLPDRRDREPNRVPGRPILQPETAEQEGHLEQPDISAKHAPVTPASRSPATRAQPACHLINLHTDGQGRSQRGSLSGPRPCLSMRYLFWCVAAHLLVAVAALLSLSEQHGMSAYAHIPHGDRR
jgi:hypothetical protein